MKKWKYLTVVAICHDEDGERTEVLSVDGDKATPILKKGTSLFHPDERVALPDYLDSLGEEGWEVTGITSTTAKGAYGGSIPFLIILKKPTPE